MFKQQNPSSNQEIHVPFEHEFWLKSINIIGQCDMMSMANVEEATWFLERFYIVHMVFSRDFK